MVHKTAIPYPKTRPHYPLEPPPLPSLPSPYKRQAPQPILARALAHRKMNHARRPLLRTLPNRIPILAHLHPLVKTPFQHIPLPSLPLDIRPFLSSARNSAGLVGGVVGVEGVTVGRGSTCVSPLSPTTTTIPTALPAIPPSLPAGRPRAPELSSPMPNYTLDTLCKSTHSNLCVVCIPSVTIYAYRLTIDDFRTIVGFRILSSPRRCDCLCYSMHKVNLNLRYIACEHKELIE